MLVGWRESENRGIRNQLDFVPRAWARCSVASLPMEKTLVVCCPITVRPRRLLLYFVPVPPASFCFPDGAWLSFAAIYAPSMKTSLECLHVQCMWAELVTQETHMDLVLPRRTSSPAYIVSMQVHLPVSFGLFHNAVIELSFVLFWSHVCFTYRLVPCRDRIRRPHLDSIIHRTNAINEQPSEYIESNANNATTRRIGYNGLLCQLGGPNV